MVRCGSTNGYKKRQVFKRDWTMCSRYHNYSRFNSQHNLRGLYDYLMSTRIFTLNFFSIRYSYELQDYEESGYSLDLV